MTPAVPSEKLTTFFSRYSVLSHKKGVMIFEAEEEPNGILFLREGYVKMYSVSQEGKELIVNIFKPGSYFPMLLALGDIQNTYFFQTMTLCQARRAPKDAVLTFLRQEPEEMRELTRRIMVGMGGLLSRMEYLLSHNARVRVLSVLVSCAKRFGENEGTGIIIQLPLTHQDIAGLAGLTRETTSLEMEKLQKDGMLSYHKRLIVVAGIEKLEEDLYIHRPEESFPRAL